mgnify:CR=1 FL=1|tara:strand:- start:5334 stop:5828 length:495 start_codon:yes stop_codon:yes gene_type:complete
MADRLDWKVSVTPVKQTAAGTDGGGVQAEVIAYDFKKSLGGGNSSGTWAGNNTSAWADDGGTPQHTLLQSRTSNNTITVSSGDDALWIKHTGFKYDASVTTGANVNKGSVAEDTTVVIITAASQEVCRLKSGEGVLLPSPKNATWTLTDDAGGEAVAVEYAVFT